MNLKKFIIPAIVIGAGIILFLALRKKNEIPREEKTALEKPKREPTTPPVIHPRPIRTPTGTIPVIPEPTPAPLPAPKTPPSPTLPPERPYRVGRTFPLLPPKRWK